MALDHVACTVLKEVFTNVEEKPGKCITPFSCDY
jgi:hypothetical protein